MIDRELLIPHLDAYREYLQNQQKNNVPGRYLSNSDENYKRDIAAKAQEILSPSEWNVDEVGSGEIGKKAIRAVQSHINLVGKFQVSSFKDDVEGKKHSAEAALFDLFHERKEQETFEKLCEVFGRKYDIISYLYFIYDSSRYLPLRPSIFDSLFDTLKIPLRTTGRCSWKNYNDFIKIVDEVRTIMEEYYQAGKVDLLDAHSFLWDLEHRIKGEGDDETETDPNEIDNSAVYSQYYGKGIIVKQSDKNLYVDFNGKHRIFPLPDAFEKNYLQKL